MSNVCMTCETLDGHDANGRCLFVPGGTFDPLVSVNDDGRKITWVRIAPLVTLITKKLSPAGGLVTYDEIDQAIRIYHGIDAW